MTNCAVAKKIANLPETSVSIEMKKRETDMKGLSLCFFLLFRIYLC